MCGIAGGCSIEREHAAKMQCAVAHRGPDGCGIEQVCPSGEGSTQGVWFAHARLAIIDLTEGGRQPMRDPATGNWIVFNGEIYNFREVRADLEARGEHFASTSDTEVLLRSYTVWGPACLERLRGMFAFAVWDARQQRLFLARDRLGIKPLYYYHDPARKLFLFASEVRALLASGIVPRDVSLEGVCAFLQSGSVEDPLTLVQGVKALLPGHHLIWHAGEIKVSEYWDVPLPEIGASSGKPPRLEDVYEETRDLLCNAVQEHLEADVPLSVFLSGGIDSSALVSLLGEVTKAPPHTFSIVFRDLAADESVFSDAVAKHFKTEHTEIDLTAQDVLQSTDTLLNAYDQPSIDGVNSFIIARSVHQAGFKVALSGLGGDEVFGGYTNARRVPQLERAERFLDFLPLPFRRCIAAAWSAAMPHSDGRRKIAAWLAREDGVAFPEHPYFFSRALFTPAQAKGLLSASVYSEVRERFAEGDVAQRRTAMLAHAAGADPINRCLYLETRNYMSNMLLRDTDMMSMFHGLEVRVPYLDHRLVEHLSILPGKLKIQQGGPKPLLVGSLPKTLPPLVVNRPKRGFTFPWESWMPGPLGNRVKSVILGGGGSLDGVLDPTATQKLWDDFQRGNHTWARPWAIFMLKEWANRNLGGGK